MDLKSYTLVRLFEARDEMFKATDTSGAWYVAKSEDKKRVRLNIITHLLGLIDYKALPGTR